MATGLYRDFFAATAGSAGALTGLLFVAMSVAPHQVAYRGPAYIRRIRASAALLAFTNALAVSLFSLVPTTRVGVPAAAFGIIGITFTAASARQILTARAPAKVRRGQLELLVVLLAIYCAELAAGIAALVTRPASPSAIQIIGYTLVASLLLGIARAWEFIGQRDTGLLHSLGVLIGSGGDPDDPGPDAEPADGPAEPGGPRS